MQVNSWEGAHHSYGTIDLPTELTSPMDFEPSHRCRSCAGHGTGHSKKIESRHIHRCRAAPGDGDRTSVKLRNSCRSCADSKVRCDREKPRCSRCDARDLPCEYLQSKRPGRVPGASLRQKQARQAAENSSHGSGSIAQTVDTRINDSRDASLVPAPFRLEDFTLDSNQQPARRATSVYSTSSTGHADGNTAASSPGANAESRGAYACNAPTAPMAMVTTASNMDNIPDSVAIDSFWPMEDDYGNLVDIDLANFANVSASSHASHGTVSASSPGVDANAGGSIACNAPVAPMATVTTTSNMGDIPDLVAMDSFWSMEDDYGNLVDIDLANFANVSASPYASHGTVLTTSTQASSAVPSSSSSSSTVLRQDMLGMMVPSPGTSLSSIVELSSKSSSPSCTCMLRALEILKSLSSDESPDTSSTAAEHYTQRVLSDNKDDIDASLAMLACRACSSDRFLLMILLMNAAKILTRYASAAALCRSCTSSNMPSTSSPIDQISFISDHTNQLMEISRAWGGVCMMPSAPKSTFETQTSCREAVQRVLRELHRLQRLLAQLSLRRERLRGEDESKAVAVGLTDSLAGSLMMRNGSGSQFGSRPAASHGGAASAVLTPRLHDNVLSLVEDDVRNGLGVLSAVIRDLLNNS